METIELSSSSQTQVLATQAQGTRFAVYESVKRLVDFMTSVITLVLLLPLRFAIAIKLDAPDPVSFKQNEAGRNHFCHTCSHAATTTFRL